MIPQNPDPVIKALDFSVYSCSGYVCVVNVYAEHYSTLIALCIAALGLIISTIYRHLSYKENKKVK